MTTIKLDSGHYRYRGWDIERVNREWVVYDGAADEMSPIAKASSLREAKDEVDVLAEVM
jgi:hypothetical protein